MNSPIKLPELPLAEVPAEEEFADGWKEWPAHPDYYTKDQMRAYAEQAVRDALAEYVPVACCLATSQDVLHEFSPMRDAERVARMARKLRQKLVHLYVIPENNHE